MVDYGTTLAYPHAFTIAPIEEREKWELDKAKCLRRARMDRESKPFIERLDRMASLDGREDMYSEHVIEMYKQREREGQRLRRLRRERRLALEQG